MNPGNGSSPSIRSFTPENLLLGLLLETSHDGYQLNRILKQELNQIWRLSQSQLYATLKRLEARGWVTSSQTASQRGLPRRLFTLTDAGRQQVMKWLTTPSPCSVQVIRLELPARLYILNRLNPQQVSEVINSQRAVIQEGLRRLEEQLNRIPAEQTYNRMACEMRLHQVQALLKWFDKSFN
ncbi:MAG: PadR family transcriptional regulator [Chloroflexota bacterium]